MLPCAPQVNTETEGHADMIECLRSTVGEMRQRWKWSGLDCQHPDAVVLASNGSFGFEHTGDQGDELPQKLTRGGCRGDTLRQLEQRGPLLRRQASMYPPLAAGLGELPAEIPSRGDIPPAIGNRRSRLCSLGADLGLFERLRPRSAYHDQLRWQQPYLRRNRNL